MIKYESISDRQESVILPMPRKCKERDVITRQIDEGVWVVPVRETRTHLCQYVVEAKSGTEAIVKAMSGQILAEKNHGTGALLKREVW